MPADYCRFRYFAPLMPVAAIAAVYDTAFADMLMFALLSAAIFAAAAAAIISPRFRQPHHFRLSRHARDAIIYFAVHRERHAAATPFCHAITPPSPHATIGMIFSAMTGGYC